MREPPTHRGSLMASTKDQYYDELLSLALYFSQRLSPTQAVTVCLGFVRKAWPECDPAMRAHILEIACAVVEEMSASDSPEAKT